MKHLRFENPIIKHSNLKMFYNRVLNHKNLNHDKNNISEAYLILFLRANLSVASSIEYLKNKLGIRIVFLSANKQSAFHWKILKEFKWANFGSCWSNISFYGYKGSNLRFLILGFKGHYVKNSIIAECKRSLSKVYGPSRWECRDRIVFNGVAFRTRTLIVSK